jgi:rubrerythrin
MKIFDILNTFDLDKITQENPAEVADRREIFRQIGSWTKKLAVAAVPFGIATVSTTKAHAAPADVLGVLNFALLLEHLESEFYMMGLESGVIPKGTNDEKVFMQISKHEKQHVEFLKKTISALGGTPMDKPKFDFTAKGMFMPFSDYNQFKILAQAFEDTGVRAYKGQAPNLMENKDVLTAALQIHSVEARHASEVRRMRGLTGWVVWAGDGGTGVPATTPIYKGEGNTKHAGIEVKNVTPVSEIHITSAFDEPLTKEEVTAIASLFLA